MELVNTVPKINPEDFEEMVNSNMKVGFTGIQSQQRLSFPDFLQIELTHPKRTFGCNWSRFCTGRMSPCHITSGIKALKELKVLTPYPTCLDLS